MQFLDNKINIFLATILGALAASAVIKIDSYEHNQLVNLNDSTSKLVLSSDSYKKLNLSEDSWFNYFQDQNAFSQRIINISASGDKYIILLSGNTDITPMINISYKLGSTPILNRIFSF